MLMGFSREHKTDNAGDGGRRTEAFFFLSRQEGARSTVKVLGLFLIQ